MVRANEDVRTPDAGNCAGNGCLGSTGL